MEGLKAKFVKPSTSGTDTTEGKVYEVYDSHRWGYPTVNNNTGYPILIRLEKCLHLGGGDWIPCDENGAEISTYRLLGEKIQAMSAKEIILTMVDSIKNPVMRVDMDDFGRKEGGHLLWMRRRKHNMQNRRVGSRRRNNPQ